MEEVTGSAEPEDAQKWISAAEAAEMLGLSRSYFMQTAKKRGYTRRKANRNAAPLFLRKEIESWADFRGLRRKWLAKYPGADGRKRYTEKIDLETAQRLFITTKEAAVLLGLAQSTIRRMVHYGRLVSYQTEPGHQGVQLWFSRRAVMQLAEDPERLRRRESYLKGLQGAGGRMRKRPDPARNVRGVPKGWLTTLETAERLGVNSARVRDLRLLGRLQGEHIWRRDKPMKRWYYPDYEVERLISQREQVKALAGLPDIPVPTAADEPPPPPIPAPAPIAEALPLPAGEERRKETRPTPPSGSPFRLDADGPEPKWACDDVNLTRAFYLQGRSEY